MPDKNKNRGRQSDQGDRPLRESQGNPHVSEQPMQTGSQKDMGQREGNQESRQGEGGNRGDRGNRGNR